ncbi:uncharacterized protein N0V96_007075 [Colletotrichum fioriniae]|uniref:uncharacterized protein n=1 Tax=Colletotrichum fioriniae TaxID=710243 RepID=UPI0032DB00DB|nr:hypothetical protein N0V96_007075 [Colletotrichum fioriniae]
MPPRKGSPKVKTGCRTCKARKVKCDETKPKCMRCTSSGRQCAGYEPTLEHGLSWYRPQQLTAHDQREGRAFQFFSHMVGPVLSGPMDTYFWTHLVVQFSHFEPAVRHAVLAISSLYEDFHDGARVTRQKPGNDFALSHYSAAIQRIKSAQDEQLVLLVCILFICIEYLQGDVEAALRHCKHGIMILNRSAIDDLMIHAIRFVSGEPTAFDRQDLETRLGQFHEKLTEFDNSLPQSESAAKVAICSMLMRFEMAKIQIDTIGGKKETRFDKHVEGFRRTIELARRASHLRKTYPDNRPHASFTFESGFLSPMSFVSNKCRDLKLRLEALDFMVELAAPKEGFTDVGTLYRIGRRSIEVEHGISLIDGTIEKDPITSYT